MKTLIFAKNILLSNFMRLASPYKLNFSVTYRCNLRCWLCKIWRKENKTELNIEEIERFFSVNNKFNWIDLTGGEIFLRNDIIDIIRCVIKNCKNLYLLHFPTNGWLTQRIIAQIKNISFLKPKKCIITVSLDGPPEIHDKLRGVKGSWQNAVETFSILRHMKLRNIEVYIGVTLSKYNFNSVRETYYTLKEKIPEIGYGDFHFNIAHTSNHFYANTDIDLKLDEYILKDMDEFRKQKKSFSVIRLLEDKYQKLCHSYIKTGELPFSCRALSASLFIDSYGDIYPCSMWDRKIANIRDFNFDLNNIWNTTHVRELQRRILDGNCPRCWTPCESYQNILGNFFML